MAPTSPPIKAWWKEAVIFQDTNGDGWGDVPGITSRLDYLKDLGVDIVWVSPIYKSPQVDMGYDISDYKSIDPRYGTMEDVDTLIAELKKRDMKLMMDFVANHTSDQHDWFIESRKSKKNPKRDWYIWKPARRGDKGERLPPNNWSMQLGEANSAWHWDEDTQEYYLGLFTREQPDLNWELPEVRAAVYDVLEFWLQKGCCGFRMDVINHISKDQRFPDADVTVPGAPYQPGWKFYANGPRQHEFLKEMHDKVLKPYGAVTVGEMPFVQDEGEILKVVGADQGELNMIFIFTIVSIDDVPGTYRLTLRDWKLTEFKQMVTKWQNTMIDNDGWNTVFTGNHDNGRSVTRFTSDKPAHRFHGAKLLALMQTTLSGTPFVYQGEEFGMCNFSESWPIEEYKDIESINFWKKTMDLYPHDEAKHREATHVLHVKARDHARTPVQWSAEPNAGFCSNGCTPWMRVNDDFEHVNAASQLAQQPLITSNPEANPLRFWQYMLAQRKERADTVIYGDYTELDAGNEEVFAYTRTPIGKSGGLVVVLNFTDKEVGWSVPGGVKVGKWVVSSYCGPLEGARVGGDGEVKLRAWEGVMGEIE